MPSKKRKKRNSSGKSSDQSWSKLQKQRGPSDDSVSDVDINCDILISEVLSQSNAVLYESVHDICDLNKSVFDDHAVSVQPKQSAGMADVKSASVSTSEQPTNLDILNYLKGLGGRLDSVEKRIESIDNRVSNFDKEVKRIWVALDDKVKRVDDRVSRIEDKVDGADIGAALLQEKVQGLEKERDTRVFTGVPDSLSSGHEAAEVTERKLRAHLHEALHLTKDMADSVRLERVHRSPGSATTGKVRPIVAKCTYFKDRVRSEDAGRNSMAHYIVS